MKTYYVTLELALKVSMETGYAESYGEAVGAIERAIGNVILGGGAIKFHSARIDKITAEVATEPPAVK